MWPLPQSFCAALLSSIQFGVTLVLMFARHMQVPSHQVPFFSLAYHLYFEMEARCNRANWPMLMWPLPQLFCVASLGSLVLVFGRHTQVGGVALHPSIPPSIPPAALA